jgi:2-haloalkanoic acid dehalogenase type II
MTDRWATFDVYGTLIDWELGIAQAMAGVWPEADEPMLEHLLERFHEVEPEIEQDSAAPYREVLRDTLAKLALDENLAVPVGMEFALADSLPSWPAFDEVPSTLNELHARGWKLGLLSNTDPDLLAASVEHLGITPDVTITATEAGSYKPAHGHWKAFYERTGADRHGHHHVHVAEGVFHDLAPCSELGITAVWINRLSEVTNYPRAAELENLTTLPDVLDELRPADPGEA